MNGHSQAYEQILSRQEPPQRREDDLRTSVLAGAMKPLSQIKPALGGRYLVKGWIDLGTLSVVYGESNVGKTFLALEIALHVAAGFAWRGFRVTAGGGPVIYIAGEGGSGINNRIEAMRRTSPDLFAAIAERGFVLLPVAVDLCTSNDATNLIAAMRQVIGDTQPALIVVDTLARSIGGGDENTAKDMGVLVGNVDRLRAETGAHVMVIHHSGKDASKGARGSGSLRAAVDTEIELTRSGDIVTAQQRKQRDMPCDKLFGYRLRSVDIGTDEDGDPVTSAVIEQTDPVTGRSRTEPNGQARTALTALQECIREHGVFKYGGTIPTNRRCVTLERWHAECDRHSLTSSDSEEATRKAFYRARDRLRDIGKVAFLDGYAWIVSQADCPIVGEEQDKPF